MSGRQLKCDPQQRTLTVTPTAQRSSEFDSVLRAIAAHDLQQPLQTIQSSYELLSLGARTNAELRVLLSAQNAVASLREQIGQLLTALRLRERSEEVKVKALQIGPLLQQACLENVEAAHQKDIGIRVVPTRASSPSPCETWCGTASGKASLVAASLSVAETWTAAFGSTCTTPALRASRC
jgi:signal transduction histidine kinase